MLFFWLWSIWLCFILLCGEEGKITLISEIVVRVKVEEKRKKWQDEKKRLREYRYVNPLMRKLNNLSICTHSVWVYTINAWLFQFSATSCRGPWLSDGVEDKLAENPWESTTGRMEDLWQCIKVYDFDTGLLLMLRLHRLIGILRFFYTTVCSHIAVHRYFSDVVTILIPLYLQLNLTKIVCMKINFNVRNWIINK